MKRVILTGVVVLVLLTGAVVQTAHADHGWATAGKILTGVAIGSVLATVVGPPVVYMQPAPVVVQPAPTIIHQPAPVYYVQPAPVYVQPVPVYVAPRPVVYGYPAHRVVYRNGSSHHHRHHR
ncbi:MAG: hypothetical protein AB1640_10265 [bacterium]